MITGTEPTALTDIQKMMMPEAAPLLDEFAEMLADVPADDLDREIDNVGHCLMLALEKTAPNLSEAMRYSLPFAFVELLRERASQAATENQNVS